MEQPKPKSNPTLMPADLGLAEHKRRDFVAFIGDNVTLDQVCEQSFWAHVAEQFRPMTRIECQWKDGSKIVHLRVRYCERNYAVVKVVGTEDLGDSKASLPPATSLRFFSKFRGPKRWSVIRRSDEALMVEDLATQGLAEAWIAENDRT